MIIIEKEKQKEAKRLEKLQTLAASVPYYTTIVEKKANLTKSTVARMNDIFESSSDNELLDFQQGFKKLHGFTDKRVFSDPKFRLAYALHESGKANSSYSLAVVDKLIPRAPARITSWEDST